MSERIEIGDVCEVIDACCETIRAVVVGRECIVIGGPTRPRFRCLHCGFIDFNHVTVKADWPDVSGNPGVPRQFLRKKRPPADDSQWIRQETVPLERFNEWRERVRRQEPVEETA